MANLTPSPKMQFLAANGDPLVGGKLYTYQSGTTVPLATYMSTTESVGNQNTNPIILDSRGEANVWISSGPYTFALYDSTNVLVWTADNISSFATLAQLAASGGSALIGFIQSGTGAQARTVQAKLRDTVSPLDFGAVADGVADDTTAWQNAINSGAKVVDGLGKTYKITSELTGVANQKIQNATILSQSLTANKAIIRWTGTAGTPQTLASNLNAGSDTVTVTTGSAFTIDDWCYLASTELLSPEPVSFGELIRVADISGNLLTFATPPILNYTTAKSATITPITPKKNITLSNIVATGTPDISGTSGFYFERCSQVLVDNVHTESCDFSHVYFRRCADSAVRNSTGNRTSSSASVTAGLDYGVGIDNGSYNILVDGYTGSFMRSIIAVGGSDGLCRGLRFTNNFGYNVQAGGIDTHAAAHDVLISGNTIMWGPQQAPGTNQDGIYINCSCPVVTNNYFYNVHRAGIIWQPNAYTTLTVPISGVFDNNVAYAGTLASATNGWGILVQTGAGTAAGGYTFAPISGVTIARMNSSGFYNNVAVQADESAINNVSISDCMCLGAMAGDGIYVYGSTAAIAGVLITGGHHETSNAGGAGIHMVGTSGNLVSNWRISNADIKRTSATPWYGISLDYTSGGIESNTTFDSGITQNYRYLVSANCTGTTFDYRKNVAVTVDASNTYTVVDADYDIIANRAATVTLTLPDATKWTGRMLNIKTVQAQTVVSASSNVIPITEPSTAGTAILAATDGAWAHLRSNGTAWVVMARG
jgi:hypothetical protein